MWPVSGSPSRKMAVTSAAEFAGNGFYTSLPSHRLTASGSFPPFTWLCEKNPSRKSVDWHAQYVAKPAQPIECDQFIYRGDFRGGIKRGRSNKLLIRLLKTLRQPTTSFALLVAHQGGSVPEFPSI
ncbi:hypothetical protein CSKR_105149 [Clonorchis sinensis]|uniref:Uncharacterized protein n=1 Tax=Clonorchis sinensis TaxID=79923 RepID=A0A3R7GAZ9_CLOSI|nr:hypothetical protein CSKR_105149 [Clonorchis sinensis]